MPRIRLAALLVTALAATATTASAAAAQPALEVMTFNIRYGSAADGDNSWPYRRDLVAAIIAREAPAVLAIQEALAFQLDELGSALDGYRKVGQHRDGGTEGEFAGLYIRTDVVDLVDEGEFWLSPTPTVVASRGWDAALHRTAAWVDLQLPGLDDPIRVYGTHFDHRGEQARVESARLIAAHAREGGLRTLVLGDLNVPDGDPALHAFAAEGYRSAVSALHPGERRGTFNAFSDPTGGGDDGRIDHVLVGPGFEIIEARIIDERVAGLFPSDHFPVVAVVAVTPPGAASSS